MIVKHLYHSGCYVELENHILLFDYIQGDLSFNPHKKLYVFVSHHHEDHYHPDIFTINHPHITYILSSDIKTSHPVHTVDYNQTYFIDDLKIQTFFSTDIGCAFLVETENKTIYHAGDLHWWHWQGEPIEDNDYQRKMYQKQINNIQQPIDVAFVVVDKRQQQDYLLGLQYFLNHVQAHYIFPIHYFGNYDISLLLQKEKLDNPYQAQIMMISHANETFIL